MKNFTTAAVLALLLMGAQAVAQPAGPPPDGPPPGGFPPGGPGGPGGAGAPGAVDPNTVQGVAYTGSTRFTAAQLKAVTTLKPGDHVSKDGVGRDLAAITALYRSAGNIKASVAPNITHPGPGKVVVTYQIHEGS